MRQHLQILEGEPIIFLGLVLLAGMSMVLSGAPVGGLSFRQPQTTVRDQGCAA